MAKKKPGPKPKLTKGELKKAIHKHMGNLAMVARQLGVTRPTIYAYVERYGFKEEVERAREELADLAEVALVKKLQEGDGRLIEFVLRSFRGHIYNPKDTTAHEGEVVVRVVYDDEVSR